MGCFAEALKESRESARPIRGALAGLDSSPLAISRWTLAKWSIVYLRLVQPQKAMRVVDGVKDQSGW